MTVRPATLPRVAGKRTPITCGTAPQCAAIRRACSSTSKMVTSSAPQKRAALLTTTFSTGPSSLGEVLMILRISAVAVCCSRASSSSPRSRGASEARRFGVFARWLRALAGLLLALERRRIAHPKGLGLRRFSKWHYSRDLRLAEWGFGLAVHSGHRRLAISAMSALPPKSGHRSIALGSLLRARARPAKSILDVALFKKYRVLFTTLTRLSLLR